MLSETEFSSMYWYFWCVGVLVNVFLSFNPFGVFDKVLVVHVAAGDNGHKEEQGARGGTRESLSPCVFPSGAPFSIAPVTSKRLLRRLGT